MKRIVHKLGDARGTTLLEVLIALAITGIVTMSILKLYVTQHENYLTQDDITNVQQNARAAIDEISRQIRMAGHQLPAGVVALSASNTNPDTVTVTYMNSTCETHIVTDMVSKASVLMTDPADDISCFHDGQWAYIFNPDSSDGEWFEISTVLAGSNQLSHSTMELSTTYDSGTVVLNLVRVKFFVDTAAISAFDGVQRPCLMAQVFGEDSVVYAENISDLQFQFRLTNGSLVDVPVLVEDVREVLISVESRSANADIDAADGEDPYRRRTYNSSVNMRNIGS